jgi:hypothetical protein
MLQRKLDVVQVTQQTILAKRIDRELELHSSGSNNTLRGQIDSQPEFLTQRQARKQTLTCEVVSTTGNNPLRRQFPWKISAKVRRIDFRNCFGSIASVSTFERSSGATRPVNVEKACLELKSFHEVTALCVVVELKPIKIVGIAFCTRRHRQLAAAVPVRDVLNNGCGLGEHQAAVPDDGRHRGRVQRDVLGRR